MHIQEMSKAVIPKYIVPDPCQECEDLDILLQILVEISFLSQISV